MEYEYKPFEQRKALYQYRDLLKEIMTHGEDCPSPMVDGNTGEPLFTREIIGVVMKYDILENGAPVITERDISGFYKGAIGEIFGFINGARTEEQLREFGCKFWGPWVTPEKCKKRGLEPGDIGDGSYGNVWANYPTAEGYNFNQWKEIDQQMRERPELKTHRITNWIPQYTIRNSNHQQKVTVCPCHGDVIFFIRPDKTLDMLMYQRSCDVILGLPSNLVEYTAVLLAMAETHDLKPGTFIHSIANAHIYNNTFEYAEEMISRETEAFPTLKTINHHDRVWEYRKDDFELTDYHPKAKILKIPVGV
jgi:thymidylate synthase